MSTYRFYNFNSSVLPSQTSVTSLPSDLDSPDFNPLDYNVGGTMLDSV